MYVFYEPGWIVARERDTAASEHDSIKHNTTNDNALISPFILIFDKKKSEFLLSTRLR